MKFAVFAKHLQTWPLETCCERVKNAGFDGLDLTVRPGGYVPPGDGFAPRFASAVKLIRSFGLDVPLITTGLISATDPAAESTLNFAVELGIREAKLHYWAWDGHTPLPQAVELAQRELDGLDRLAAAAGVRINLHNHSGDFVTHSPWAISQLLRNRDPSHVGAYLDPAHFTLEGGLSGWRSSLEQLLPRAALLAVKDFRWIDSPTNPAGPQERRWVPVGAGNVPWSHVMQMIVKSEFNGPISIHGEYQGRWSWRELDAAAVLEQCVADRKHIAANLGGANRFST